MSREYRRMEHHEEDILRMRSEGHKLPQESGTLLSNDGVCRKKGICV